MPLAGLSAASKVFATPAGEVTAVREVDLSVEPGDFCLITGRSGSGKSTLLALLGTLAAPSAGEVRLFGESVGSRDDAALSALRALRLGFVFQFAGLLPTLTAFDNVRLPLLFGAGDSDAAALRARELLRRVGLGDRLSALPAELSGGEQRRVAIARALIAGPELLLADEPTGDLDSETEQEVMGIMSDLNREGLTIVMVSHNRELGGRASRRFDMRDGRLSEL